jgi:hypothetical protein
MVVHVLAKFCRELWSDGDLQGAAPAWLLDLALPDCNVTI